MHAFTITTLTFAASAMAGIVQQISDGQIQNPVVAAASTAPAIAVAAAATDAPAAPAIAAAERLPAALEPSIAAAVAAAVPTPSSPPSIAAAVANKVAVPDVVPSIAAAVAAAETEAAPVVSVAPVIAQVKLLLKSTATAVSFLNPPANISGPAFVAPAQPGDTPAQLKALTLAQDVAEATPSAAPPVVAPISTASPSPIAFAAAATAISPGGVLGLACVAFFALFL